MTEPDLESDRGPDLTPDLESDLERWRLDLAYDGTDFSGWARQNDRRTVQGVLEEWIPRLLRLPEPVRLTCAGRTDAGVHARGQVCHLDLAPGVIADGGTTLLRRLGRVLPSDVVVTALTRAPAGFDARFAAIWRRYCYRLVDRQRPPDPLLRRTVAHWPHSLDLEAMNAAATNLLGLRDFAAFCRRRDGATTVRTLIACEGRRVRTEHDQLIEISVRADAFCHSMVRALVGSLVRVGSGARDRRWPVEMAERAVRDPGNIVMPPHGLTLEQVGYPDHDQLSCRVREARTVREPAVQEPST